MRYVSLQVVKIGLVHLGVGRENHDLMTSFGEVVLD
jgi:hypothetical protein